MESYYLPTKIYFGSGILKFLPDLIGEKVEKIYLVIDNFFIKRKLDKYIKRIFGKTEIKFFNKIRPNPTIEDIEKVRGLIERFNPQLVIALGGGSVLDTGKSTAILAKNSGLTFDFLTGKKKLTKKGIRFVAVPTTAGTGSEVTPWATIWKEKVKYSLKSSLMFPNVAVCDPELTLSMSPFLTACTGMDALSQAIEAYWSIYSSPLSDVHAVQAILLVINNLEKAVKNPHKLFYREQMMLAALEAGRAFSQTMTTAVHAVSYPITAYFGIPHGYACALTLPAFLKYNYYISERDCNDKRGPEFVKKRINQIIKLLNCNNINEAYIKIKKLMESIGLNISLSQMGVDNFDKIIEHGFNPERVVNNPRILTRENLKKLLKEIY